MRKDIRTCPQGRNQEIRLCEKRIPASANIYKLKFSITMGGGWGPVFNVKQRKKIITQVSKFLAAWALTQLAQ